MSYDLGARIDMHVPVNISLLVCGIALCACGHSGGAGDPAPSPPPVSTSLSITATSPSYAIAGTRDFTLEVDGTNFTSNSELQWKGTPIPTQYGSGTVLYAPITAAQIAAAGTIELTVHDTASAKTSDVHKFFVLSPAAATVGVMQLISIAPDGSAANGDTLVSPSISRTGRYVAFQSMATNLAAVPTNGFGQIYLRDTCIGAESTCKPITRLASATYDGSAPNGHSRLSAVSADGRFVAFDSTASNILPNTGLCGTRITCLYLSDLCTGVSGPCTPKTILVSKDANGSPIPGAEPSITPDGRFITYSGTITPLVVQTVVSDTCYGAPSGCRPQSFIASLNVANQPGNGNSLGGSLTPDGRYAGFITFATNMQDPTAPATASTQSLQWRDTCLFGSLAGCTPITTRQDVSTNGEVNNGNLAYDAAASISSNGRYLGFGSDFTATNLVPQNLKGWANVFWRDTCVGAPSGCKPSTTLVSQASDGTIANCGSGDQSMSEDGRFIVFSSIATNLDPLDNFGACSWTDIYGRDTCAGAGPDCSPSTVRLAISDQVITHWRGDAPSSNPVISGDGHYVVFLSSSSNFIPSVKVQNLVVYLGRTGF